MKYDLAQEHEIKRIYMRLKQLETKGALVDLTDKSKRSLSQNNYMYLLFACFSLEYGCSLDYAKQIVFKEMVCPEVFMYERKNKFGITIPEKRSTANIPKEKLTECIGRFKEWAGQAGILLPEATDQGWLRSIELEADRMKQYLK